MPIFDNFSISIDRGTLLLLTGPNGVGKTTFLDLVAYLKQPTLGHIEVAANNLEYLQQDYARSLFPWHDVAWNICLPLLVNHPLSKSERYATANKLCKKLELELPLRELPFRLSGGQKHLVTLLRSFVGNPDILLLDEPATGLDSINATKFWSALNRYKTTRPDLTVVCVSHQNSLDFHHERLEMFGRPVNAKRLKGL